MRWFFDDSDIRKTSSIHKIYVGRFPQDGNFVCFVSLSLGKPTHIS